MENATKWLVCAGPDEFLFIASALLAARCDGGIVWEPLPARAYAYAVQECAQGTVSAVVGAACVEVPSEEVACRLGELANGVTVFCTGKARSLAAQLTARGVTAVVEPAALLRTLLGAARRGAAADREEVGKHGRDIATRDAAQANACEILPGEGKDAPEDTGCKPSDQGGTGDFGATSVLGDGPASPHAMRATGRLPRLGVADGLCDIPPAGVRAGCADRPGCTPVPSPAAGDAGLRFAGRTVGGVRTEPVVYRPVIDLPQADAPGSDAGGSAAHVPTLCFASSRGGVGKSALAALAAVALARDGLRVALIDLDFQFGTCLGYLGADETDGLFDGGAMPSDIRLDDRLLARCRAAPEPNLTAYEFCRAPEQAEMLSGLASDIIRRARTGADVAIVDLPSGVNETVAQTLELSDRCLLVTDQRAFALESLSSQQQLCARMGIARTKLVTLMNRCDPRHRDEGFLSRAQFEVQAPQTMRVVDGGGEVMQMLGMGSAGELLTMRNRFALSATDMVHALCADLGCRPNGAASPVSSPIPSWGGAPREGMFRRHRREKRGEQLPCPF